MADNKTIRKYLERDYGKKCMIHEGLGIKFPIKPPKNSKEQHHYKSLTLHHLKPVREKGPTTRENGTVVCEACHRYLERLPDKEREKINDMLREYKQKLDKQDYTKVKIELVDESMEEVSGLKINFTEISFEEPEKKKQKYNRGNTKAEMQKLKQEWEDR